MTSTTRNTTSEAYQYDATGNGTRFSVGSAVTNHTLASDSNRVTALSGASSKNYSYDASGNLTSDGSYTYRYDNVGRLRQMLTLAGGSITNLIYNAQGHLAIKTNYGKPVQFVYDEAGRLIGEYADPATRNPTQETVWLGDTPVATLQPVNGSLSSPKLHYVYADHLDTPRRIVDPVSKKAVWYWEGEAFGNTLPDEDPDKDSVKLTYNLRYPGQYYLRDMGWFHNWHRDYSPVLGRYVQSDPIGLDGGINTYAYVGGNPAIAVDPLGLAEIIVWEPVGRGASSFGHVSSVANGRSYSWGTGGWDSNKDPASYIDNNTNFRSGVGQVIPMTPDQENKFESCLQKQGGKYNIFTNNCGSAAQSCLREVGINDFYQPGNTMLGVNKKHVFPVDLGNGLLLSQAVSTVKQYPAKREPTVWERLQRAPWAWGF